MLSDCSGEDEKFRLLFSLLFRLLCEKIPYGPVGTVIVGPSSLVTGSTKVNSIMMNENTRFEGKS